MILTQGKYKGKDVTTVPTEWLEWAAVNMTTLPSAEAAAVVDECRRRGGVLPFENNTGDVHAPEQDGRKDYVTGLDGLRRAWHKCAEVFEQATGDRLSEPRIAVMTRSRTLGLWYPAARVLKISNYWILPRQALQNVIIHEMCHQWITEKNIADNAPHGREWKRIAGVMSRATGHDIRRTSRPEGFVANDMRRREPQKIRFYDPA